jgi:sulfite dehydrogenase
MIASTLFSRRRLLAAGAAASGLALTACATPGGPSIGRVVVVGGGFGGATAARYLRLWSNAEVTLIERNPSFVSCPISNLVLGGYKQIGELTHGYDGLAGAGVKIVRGEVTTIDAAAKTVRLADGSALAYDRLIVSPGIDFLYEQLPGLQTPLAQDQVLHGWKAGPQTVALRRQLEGLRDGGLVALSIPKSPYRCPPGPYERACVIAAYLQQAKPKSKLIVLDANPEVQSKKALFEKVFKDQYSGVLEYRPNAELKEVDASTRVAKFEFEDIRADVLNVVPPQRAADIAKSAGLINVNNRWVGVHWLTMESTAVPGVHVLGDAVFPGPGMPKSGHMANQHAKVAAAAIIQLLKGEAVNPTPVVMNTCYSFVSASEVIHVASVHQYNAEQKTFVPVPGAGGVSSAPSALEGRYALSWAQNIWADALNLPRA